MWLNIPYTSQDAKESWALNGRAEIDEVRLVESHVFCKKRLWDAPKALRSEVSFAPQMIQVESGRLFTTTNFAFRIYTQAKESPEEDMVSVVCSFETAYSLLPGYEPTEKEKEAFRKANAVFNAWPYFREYAQNSVSRMNYPMPSIPFLRLMVQPSPAATKQMIGVEKAESPNKAKPKIKRKTRTLPVTRRLR